MQITEVKTTKIVACIFKNKNKILISSRPYPKPYYGFYEFPGGKLLKNESHEDGLKREIKEELDIEIFIKEKLGEENFKDNVINVTIHYYICSHKSGKITLKEHLDSAWVSKEDFKNYVFAEGDKDIISLL